VKIRQAVALLMIAIGMGAAQDRLAETLRKGVVEEEKNQNLYAAIQAYQSVLSQFDQDRQTAATALFRLAECYRKQGKNDQAIAAYKRVASEFQDQTKLAEQSRTVLAQTFKAQTDQAAGATDPRPSTVLARRRYRDLTLAQIKDVQAQLAWEQKKFELGAGTQLPILQVQAKLKELQGELAAFDASASPEQSSPAEAYHRHMALNEATEIAKFQLKTAQDEFNLGKVDQSAVTAAQVRLRELQRQRAALDAGMVEPSTTSPPR